jgi:glycerol-3-phosphate responsive antiterminator
MQPLKAVLPLALVLGLVTAGTAAASTGAAGKHSSRHSARAAGGDVPPVLPSIVRVNITRGEKALDHANSYVDKDNPAKAIISLKNARRNMYAAWKGAVYVIQTAPPPPADSASVHKASRKAHKSGGAVTGGTVYADPVTTAVAVLGFQHDVATAGIGMTDGAKGTLLGAVNTTIFAALDRRDAAIKFISQLPPPPAAAARVHASLHAHAAGTPVAVDFPTLMPGVVPDISDEIQEIQGELANGAVVPTGKKILRDALVQDLLTTNTINTLWPPVPAD